MQSGSETLTLFYVTVVLKTSNLKNSARANNIEKFAGQLITVRFLVQICRELAFKSTIKKTWTEGE
jgi:hypothetical protein